MFKLSAPALCLCLLAAPAYSQTPEVQAQAAAAEPTGEKVLVVGQRPGPGLWKISKDDHVLWVFATYSPLPKNMQWRSHEVESILATSQEYLSPPSVSSTVGVFRGLTLLPRLIGIKNNPDGAKLRDVVPADIYARWLVLKAKYIGSSDGVESERPFFAADTLYREALRHAGLSNGQEASRAIEQLVKKSNIKMTHSAVKLDLEEPAKSIKDFKKSSLDDAACFASTLERLETDIDAMRARANAWAIGDLATIQKLSYADRDAACRSAIQGSSVAKAQKGLQAAEARMRETWLASAEKALATNTSTFAVLHLKEVLDPKGLVAALEAKGYVVAKPE
jgi:hypothetical protein